MAVKALSTSMVFAWMVSAILVLSTCGSSAGAEFVSGMTCPADFTCSPFAPRDGACSHPAIILDEKLKTTRYADDPYSPANESACIAKAGSAVVRRGQELRLAFSNGASKSFQDERECETSPDEHCKSYLLHDYFPKDQLLLVHILHYESDEWLLISQLTGQEAKMVAPPGYSPDKKWLASVYATEGPDDGNNGVDIVPSDLSIERPAFHYRPKEYEMWEFDRWDGDDRLLLKVTWRVNGNPELVTWPAEAIREDGKWILNITAPASTRP